jgi:hypothetical protein
MLPSVIVSRQGFWRWRSTPIVAGSSRRTVRSARLPGTSGPFSLSSKVSAAPLTVSRRSATLVSDQPDTGTPVDDYLQFAAGATKPVSGGSTQDASTTDDATSPLDGYLAAAGVDPGSVSAEPAPPPPEETLNDPVADAGPDTTQDQAAAGDDAPVDVPDIVVDDDPQHHGV